MRKSNEHARIWMLENGFDDIWFKMHVRRHDLVYSRQSNYKCLDLYNLFDGMAWLDGRPVFFQIKTNNWANQNPLRHWAQTHMQGMFVLSINVKKVKSRWVVKNRLYERNEDNVFERSI